MELPSVDHVPPHAPISTCPRTRPSKNFDLGNALKCLEEGIHAIKKEQQNAESLMFGLKQEIQVTTCEISASCRQMGSELNECQALFNDVMKNSCTQAQDLQRNVSDGEDIRKAAIDEIESIQFERPQPLPANDRRNTGDIVDMIKRTRKDPRSVLDDAHVSLSIHAILFEKMEAQYRRHKEFEGMVISRCQWYHSIIPSKLVMLIHSGAFNNFCAFLTVVFAAVVGVEANTHIEAVMDGKMAPTRITTVVNCLNCWFVAEVTLRLMVGGAHYFLTPHWRWNVFDMVIAALSFVDMFAHIGTFGFMRVLRVLKIAKALRIVGLVNWLEDLRLIVASMLASLMSLLWSLAFLVMIIYLAAVIFVDAAAHYVKERDVSHGANHVKDDINARYDSLANAMYTLLLCTTGGMDWFEAARPMWHIGWVYGCSFVCYILVCLLGVLNVITSVFVENASNVKIHDRDYAVSQELRQMETQVEETMKLFDTLVESGAREITTEDLEDFLSLQHVMAHFSSIGIQISDPTFVSHALGDTDAGCVDVRSFVRGCISLRGPAKQSDTLYIISRLRKLETVIVTMMHDTAQDFKLIAELAARSKFSGRHDKQFPHRQNVAAPHTDCSEGLEKTVAIIDEGLANLEADTSAEAFVYNKDDEDLPPPSSGFTGGSKLWF